MQMGSSFQPFSNTKCVADHLSCPSKRGTQKSQHNLRPGPKRPRACLSFSPSRVVIYSRFSLCAVLRFTLSSPSGWCCLFSSLPLGAVLLVLLSLWVLVFPRTSFGGRIFSFPIVGARHTGRVKMGGHIASRGAYSLCAFWGEIALGV